MKNNHDQKMWSGAEHLHNYWVFKMLHPIQIFTCLQPFPFIKFKSSQVCIPCTDSSISFWGTQSGDDMSSTSCYFIFKLTHVSFMNTALQLHTTQAIYILLHDTCMYLILCISCRVILNKIGLSTVRSIIHPHRRTCRCYSSHNIILYLQQFQALHKCLCSNTDLIIGMYIVTALLCLSELMQSILFFFLFNTKSDEFIISE